ncbi:recombinase family protein [Pseudonocardia sp. DLS-67]
MTLRVLGRVRLSRDTDASTSVERQREDIEKWAADNDAVVVGYAEDVDVSGKVDPFNTPDLGPWLKPPKMNEWEAMVAWKWDRISRGGQRPKQALLDWMEDHGKYIITIVDHIDTRKRDFLTDIQLAFTAESAASERQAIVDRQVSSQKKLRMIGRFRGGPIPFGYKTEPIPNPANPDKPLGYVLAIHEANAALVRELVDIYMSGKSLGAVAAEMNARGVPTPQKSRGAHGKWRSGTLLQMFKSRTMLGETVYKGRVVRGEDGSPIRRAEPIIAEELFDRLQQRLSNARKQPVGSFSGKKKLLLDIIFCAICGSKMYFVTTAQGARTYWRCSAATHPVEGGPKCPGKNIPAKRVESLALDYVTATIGDEPVQEEIFFPAEGSGAELKDVEETIKGLRWEWDNGIVDKDDPDEVADYRTRLAALTERRKAYREMPNKPARYELVATGGKWGETLAAAETPEEKRAVLLKLGMRMNAARGEDGDVTVSIGTNLDILRRTVPGAMAGPVHLPFMADEFGGPVVLVDGVYVPTDHEPRSRPSNPTLGEDVHESTAVECVPNAENV